MKKKNILKIIILIIIVFFIMVLSYKMISTFNNKYKKYDEIIEMYLLKVKSYQEDNNIKSVITNLTLADIMDKYNIEETINPITRKPFDLNMRFCIINNNGNYEYLVDDGTNCHHTEIAYTNTPKKDYNGYLYSQIININFSDLEGLEYYIMTSKNASINNNVNFFCGKNSMPLECEEIHSTKSIKKGNWYRVSGDTNVTYDIESLDIGYLYILVTDHKGYEERMVVYVAKIDRISPVVVIDTPKTQTNSITIPIISIKDDETGIASSVCRYGNKEGNYTAISMSNTKGKLSKCSINYILKDKTYYYQICAYDNVGNMGCAVGSSLIRSVKNPIFSYTDYYASISFENKNTKNLTYYIKSSEQVLVNDSTIAYCGKSVLPEECITSKTKRLLPNVWYKVSGNISVINNSDVNTTLYALIYSNDEYAISTTATIPKSQELPKINFGQ